VIQIALGIEPGGPNESKEGELRCDRFSGLEERAFSEGQALRECALLGYPESHIRILREIFPALFTIYLEERAYDPREYCGSATKGQLRAVVQDLRHTAWFLALTARQGIDSDAGSEQRLGDFADRLAVHVMKLADHIEKRIVPRRKEKTVEGET